MPMMTKESAKLGNVLLTMAREVAFVWSSPDVTIEVIII